MTSADNEWQRKGATLGHKTACKEYGLTEDDLFRAIRAGRLQYREASTHGNPWFRLLRREVEGLVKREGGSVRLRQQSIKAELARSNRKLRRLKKQIAETEKEISTLLANLEKAK